ADLALRCCRVDREMGGGAWRKYERRWPSILLAGVMAAVAGLGVWFLLGSGMQLRDRFDDAFVVFRWLNQSWADTVWLGIGGALVRVIAIVLTFRSTQS